jgi:hypothetical protein
MGCEGSWVIDREHEGKIRLCVRCRGKRARSQLQSRLLRLELGLLLFPGHNLKFIVINKRQGVEGAYVGVLYGRTPYHLVEGDVALEHALSRCHTAAEHSESVTLYPSHCRIIKSESFAMTNAPSSPARATMYESASPSANRTSRSAVDRSVDRTATYPRGGAMRVSASDRGVARAALEVRKKRLALFTQFSCKREMMVGYLRGGEGPDSPRIYIAKCNRYCYDSRR